MPASVLILFSFAGRSFNTLQDSKINEVQRGFEMLFQFLFSWNNVYIQNL